MIVAKYQCRRIEQIILILPDIFTFPHFHRIYQKVNKDTSSLIRCPSIVHRIIRDHHFLGLIGSLNTHVEHCRGFIHVLHFRCRSKALPKLDQRQLSKPLSPYLSRFNARSTRIHQTSGTSLVENDEGKREGGKVDLDLNSKGKRRRGNDQTRIGVDRVLCSFRFSEETSAR